MNKERLQNYNDRLTENNISLETIKEKINELPDIPVATQLEITPTKEEQVITGLYNNVIVKPVTNEIDENIISENIKKDTEILGVKGTFVGAKYKPKYISFSLYTEDYFEDELTQLDTSEMQTMRKMFYHDTSYSFGGKQIPYIKNIDVSGFNTSKVEDMAYMFAYQNPPINSSLKSFDTSNVKNMSYMFQSCGIRDVDQMKNWDVSKVEDMSYMFERNLTIEGDADFSGWNVSNVKTFKGMFAGLTWSVQKKINFNFDGWLLSNATTMESMFEQQGYIEELNINHFKPEKLGSGGLVRTWYYCRNLKKLDISSWNCPTLTSISSAWNNCVELQELDISGLSCEKLTNVSSAWSSCNKLTTLRFMNNFGRAFTQKSANYSNYTVNLSSCTNLTKESLMDVINKLYDLNLTYDVANGGTLYTQKLTIGETNLAKLTAEEIAIATNKGWTVA